MFITLAGAMSTAELGISLAEIIRRGKVHGICSTGANLEEDIFNLVANKHYKRVPNYRNLSDKQEEELRDAGLNRVTDTCIPEEEALRRIEHHLLKLWTKADENGQRYFPYEFFINYYGAGSWRDHIRLIPKIPGCWPPAKKICRYSRPLGRFHHGEYFRFQRYQGKYQIVQYHKKRIGTDEYAYRLVS
jgi:deoxyhypusine synthase